MQDSVIAFNHFGEYSPNVYNVLFYGGSRNRIVGNKIKGGITGISHVFHKTNSGNSGNAAMFGNVISDNVIEGISEESISFDCRGNSVVDCAAQERDVIASKANPSAGVYTVTLSNASWAGQGAPYAGWYAVMTSGAAQGMIFAITAQASAVLTLTMIAAEYALIAPSDEVVIGAPMFNNTIANNTINGMTWPTPTTVTSIVMWGLCYDNVIVGNGGDGPGTGISINSLNSLPGPIGPITGNALKAPSEHNVITSNSVPDISLLYYQYGALPDFFSLGNIVRVNSGFRGTLKIQRHEDLVDNGGFSYPDVRTNVYKENTPERRSNHGYLGGRRRGI